jgi:hypothetical protein
MMTDRHFHSGAFSAVKFHYSRTQSYFVSFEAPTLNVLPYDPVWKSDDFVPVDENRRISYKDIGIAHGDEVGVSMTLTKFSTFFYSRSSSFSLLPNRVILLELPSKVLKSS